MPAPAPAAASASSAAEAVLTFLESVGRRSEAEFYLRQFLKLPKHSFAIIAPGAAVVRTALGSLVEQLKFLADLGLFAPVALGLFDPDSAAASSERLLKRLPAAGLDASPHGMDEADLDERLRGELGADRVPILHFRPGEGLAERVDALGALAGRLGTRKLVLLRRRGGLRARGDRPVELAPGYFLPASGGRISIINLRTDREDIASRRVLPKRDQELLDTSARLLELVQPNPMLASVTSPLGLLKELFTVKGAGTLVKLGTLVTRASSYAEVDVPRLQKLLELSFGRPLAAGFFDEPPSAVYVEANYRGAALVCPGTPVPYLSKFAVEPEAQGEGMGRDLWQALSRDFPSLFWRSQPDNPIGPWYDSVCDGVFRFPEWHVYFRGVDPALVPDLIAQALRKPRDF